MKKNITLSFYRRNLPHWRVAGRPYFVTFRLKNTLPEHIVREMKLQRQQLKEMHRHPDDILSFERKSFIKIDKILDNQNDNTCYLKQPAAADIVMESFNFIENKYKWHFPYIVIMPSHVHCLASHQDKAACSLGRALGHLKKFHNP
jgi:type I restriction enzyme R subunit